MNQLLLKLIIAFGGHQDSKYKGAVVDIKI
jgi:hypothetical protein